ncbi:allantoate permease family MFS transporter [Blastopirellula marina]|nr:allantoate permease family MFS transporter [Blastopirellula marina]
MHTLPEMVGMDRQNSPVSSELNGIFLSLATGGTALLATAALAACGIRLAWPSVQPLPAGAALSIALLTAAWCASIRAAWLAAAPQKFGPKLHGLIAAVPCCAALLIARAVTFHPVSEFATFLLWFATFAQEAITLSLFLSTLGGDTLTQWLSGFTKDSAPAPAASPSLPPVAEDFAVDDQEIEEESFGLADNVMQQLTRALEGNQEQIHGLVRATFTAGQRHAYLHVGFCPPLPSLPHVELHQLEGPEVQIKPGQVLTSGVRFDLKLREASAETTLPVFEFLATSATSEASPLREAC